MKYRWTMVGFLLGLLIGRGRPPLFIIGTLIGYSIDAGWLGRASSNPPHDSQDAEPIQDPYAILDVDPQANDADIDAAYRRQIAQYHPDKVAGAAKEIRELAEKRASAINAAYDQIQKIRGK